jgi:hypothetical protein
MVVPAHFGHTNRTSEESSGSCSFGDSFHAEPGPKSAPHLLQALELIGIEVLQFGHGTFPGPDSQRFSAGSPHEPARA